MSFGFRVASYTPVRSELNQLAGIVSSINNLYPDKDDEDYHNLLVRNLLSVPGTYTGAIMYVDKIIAKEGFINNIDFSGSLDNINAIDVNAGTGIFDTLIVNGSGYFNYIQVATTGYFKSINTQELNINNDLNIVDELTVQGTGTFNGLLNVNNSGCFDGVYVRDNLTVEESGGFVGLYVRDNGSFGSINSNSGTFNNLRAINSLRVDGSGYFDYIQVATTGYFKAINTQDLTINNDLNIVDELTVQGTGTFNGLLNVVNSGSFRGLLVKDNGTFGSINTISGTFNNLTIQDLTVNGILTLNSNDAYKLSSQFWKILSDKSTKTDIETLKEYDRKMLLKLVDEMEVKTYRYKNKEQKEIGIIADEIEMINPSLITIKDGLKHVDLGSLIYGLVLKVQNLQKDIDNIYNELKKK